MKISVIIPVYNVKPFLDTCLKSVAEQTYRDMEIILADDGSTDGSGAVCDEWAERDSRIRVIHKENGGLSSARNAGIEASSGDAVFFLDSDDYISPGCIGLCADLLTEYDADISIVQLRIVAEDNNAAAPGGDAAAVEVFDSEGAIEASFYQIKFSCSAWGKLYRRQVIGGIRFPAGRYAEDLATCHLFMDNAKRIVFKDECGYFYRQRTNSIMHSFDPKRLDAIEWADAAAAFCAEKYPRIYNAALCRKFNASMHILLDLPAGGEEHDRYKPEIWRAITSTRGYVLRNGNVRGREKAAALLSYFGEGMLRKVWNSRLAVRRKAE